VVRNTSVIGQLAHDDRAAAQKADAPPGRLLKSAQRLVLKSDDYFVSAVQSVTRASRWTAHESMRLYQNLGSRGKTKRHVTGVARDEPQPEHIEPDFKMLLNREADRIGVELSEEDLEGLALELISLVEQRLSQSGHGERSHRTKPPMDMGADYTAFLARHSSVKPALDARSTMLRQLFEENVQIRKT